MFEGQTVPPHKVGIMVHCLATSRSWGKGKSATKMMQEVTRWHVEDRGWSAVGYAAICDHQGGFALGRDLDGDGNVLEETAAAARGFNKGFIHLAIAGGRGSTENDQFSDHYTPDQDKWLREAIREITAIAGRPMRIRGHNEVAAKACPGFNVREWFDGDFCQPQSAPKPTRPKTGLFAFFARLRGGRK
jgi:hypothetical protein